MKEHVRKFAWLLLALGVGILLGNYTEQSHGLKWLIIGVFCVVFGVLALTGMQLRDRTREKLVQRQMARRPHVVVIGGGTGQPVLLRGLKAKDAEITAIVTVADDGGSSGRLRSDLYMPPPGDIRNCLIALADTEPLLAELLQYRFDSGAELSGHSFGNLFLAAMTNITGDFETAVKETSRVLAVRGRVLPAARRAITLAATFEDGSRVVGESQIPLARKRIKKVELMPSNVDPLPEAIVAIAEADAIVIGPGSLYTSILPNLLVPGIADAIRKSQAKVMYVCNVMTQPGETDNFTASQHVQAIYDHVGSSFFDIIIVNSAPVPQSVIDQYESKGSYPVHADVEKLHALGVTVIARNFLHYAMYARHDADMIAMQVLSLIGREHKIK
ncbi:gluconeogenesis factor YvcK family protein [Sulfoacidibacillus ferrooxidans]|uniref:Gluconeogenesis factor n=1 Tax=Sulfoacidibacillus ferrooxidans TaxID=2005001 RepID=A0A9X1VB49_9BACL|nr:uridine diphosphate-N-acetylglucosamine-binding protein YvcK [Sulfoacidibacillus ferrooxidans]MCI0182752.1 Gluconeogenesis factor [Sulfoacidibacillus ferrooxidans]